VQHPSRGGNAVQHNSRGGNAEVHIGSLCLMLGKGGGVRMAHGTSSSCCLPDVSAAFTLCQLLAAIMSGQGMRAMRTLPWLAAALNAAPVACRRTQPLASASSGIASGPLVALPHPLPPDSPITPLAHQAAADTHAPCPRPAPRVRPSFPPLSYVLATDKRLLRLKPYSHSPVTWFRNPYVYIILVCAWGQGWGREH
jgi:hypothetical protein